MMTVLENYKPREKKEIACKCLLCKKRCVLLNQIKKRNEELMVKIKKRNHQEEEALTLMNEARIIPGEVGILYRNERDILEELCVLIIEQSASETLESYYAKEEEKKEKKEEHNKIIKKRDGEKKRYEYLTLEIDKIGIEWTMMQYEIKEDEKKIEIDREQVKSMKSCS